MNRHKLSSLESKLSGNGEKKTKYQLHLLPETLITILEHGQMSICHFWLLDVIVKKTIRDERALT